MSSGIIVSKCRQGQRSWKLKSCMRAGGGSGRRRGLTNQAVGVKHGVPSIHHVAQRGTQAGAVVRHQPLGNVLRNQKIETD